MMLTRVNVFLSLAPVNGRPAKSRRRSMAAHRKRPVQRFRIAAVASLLFAIAAAAHASGPMEPQVGPVEASPDRTGRKSVLLVKEGNTSRVAFSPDGKTLASGYSAPGTGDVGLVLWDVTSRKRLPVVPIAGARGAVGGVAFSPDGKTLAAGFQAFYSGGLVLYDTVERKLLADGPIPLQEGGVWAVAFSPDGRTLAAGFGGEGGVGGVVLWDVAARKPMADAPLTLQAGGVMDVAFSPDGKTLAASYLSQSDGGKIKGAGVVLWDVATRKSLTEESLPESDGFLSSVAFSPDGRTLATGFGHVDVAGIADGGGVVLWDMPTRHRRADGPLRVSEGFVSSVAFSPDGRTLAAGFHGAGEVGGVVIWDAVARKRLADDPLTSPQSRTTSVAFSPDGKTLAAGFGAWRGSSVVLWDEAARKSRVDEPVTVRHGRVGGVAFSPDSETLAAGFYGDVSGGGVLLWNAAARKRLNDGPLPVREGRVQRVEFSPDGKTLAAGFRSNEIVAPQSPADSQKGRLVPLKIAGKEPDAPDPELDVDERKKLVAMIRANDSGGVALWDVATRKRLADAPLPVSEGSVWDVAFSPDGMTLAAGYSRELSSVGGVVLWNLAARKRLADEPLRVTEGYVRGVAFSPDGKTLAAGIDVHGRGSVVLWDLATHERLTDEPLPVAEGAVLCVAFSPDGKTLAAAFGFQVIGGVVLWDVATRNRLADEPLRVSEGTVWELAFSPDSKTLAAGYAGPRGGGAGPVPVQFAGFAEVKPSKRGEELGIGGVVLWDLASRQRLNDDPLPVVEGFVRAVAFSPDGKSLAAGYGAVGGKVGGIVLWDVAARRRLADDQPWLD